MFWEDIDDTEIVHTMNLDPAPPLRHYIYYNNELERQKHEYENIIANMRLEHTYLHNEITRLNNSYYEKGDNKIADETEKRLCEELVDFLDENKSEMKNQTYITLMAKLSEIYKR